MYYTKERENDILPSGITLYTTALCNLNCTYCYICKDNTNALKEIDNDIKEDWETGNYIKRLKEDFPPTYLKTIKRIDLWGGETLIGMDRFTNSFLDFCKVLPNFQNISFSTNLVVPNTIEILQRLLNKISEKPDRVFYIDLQISIDGPEEINDKNRGKGVCKKVLENYNKLLELNIPENVDIYICTKPTLSNDTFDYFLNKENCKNFYLFFNDNFYIPFRKNKITKIKEVFCGIPNYAEPYNYSVEDGVTLAVIFKNFQEVEKENDIPAFRNRSLVPYVSRNYNPNINIFAPYEYSCGGGCGKLVHDITMITKNKYSVCHRSIFDAYIDYSNTKKNNNGMTYDEYLLQSRAAMTKEDFFKARKALIKSYLYPSKWTTVDIDSMILLSAKAGLILPKYLKKKNRIPVVNFMSGVSPCLDSNYRLQGSFFVQPCWWIRLLLNGAFDIMLEEIQKLQELER